MKKLFKWLLLLTAALAVGITVLLYNPGLVKGPLERYLSELAGYRISLEGGLEISPGRLSVLTAKNIRISAPAWADNRDLISVDYLRLALDTGSLFEDIVIIDSLQADNLQLNLETDANGIGNWISANTHSPDDSGRDETGGDPVVIFNKIQFNDVGLRYKTGEKGIEHLLHITSLDQHQQPDGMLHISMNGDFNDRLIELTGSIGPYANLLATHDISFAGNGHFGELSFSGNGLIDDLMAPRRPQFIFEIQGPNIDEITSMLGVDDLGAGGFSLRARGDEINDHYEADINGEIGDIRLSVSAEVSDLSELNEIDLNMSVNGPSLGSLTRVFGIENWPDKPFRLQADLDRLGGTLNVSNLSLGIGSTELVLDALLTNFPHLDASRIKLSILGDDVAQFRSMLSISGIATGPFEIHGKLDVSPDEVELLQVEVQTSLGRATLSGTLGAAPSYVGSKFHLHFEGNNARTLMSFFDIDALPEKPFRLDTRIEMVENGMLIERGVLVTIEDEHLELGGFLAFNPGSKGTDVEVRFSGQHLKRVLQRIVGDTEVPDQPYNLSGRVRVLEEGIQLENVKAELNDIKLTATGLISLGDQFLDTGFDFQLDGDDLSALGNFAIIGDSLDIFVPGQSYHAAGFFAVEDNGWHLKDVSGRIGKTDFNFDSLISNQPEWAGSDVRFSIKGPDLHGLLADQDESDLPLGAFEANGRIMLSADTLSINEFSFETSTAHGKIDLDLGWPVGSGIDAGFDVNIWGDDIRHLLPSKGAFEPVKAAYKIRAVGQKRGKLVSIKQFDADIGNLQVKAKGKVGNNPADENADIAFSATSTDLSALGRLNGDPLPAMALDFKTDFKGNAHRFVLNNLSATLGESHIAGTLDVSLEGSKPDIKLTANSNYIDIRPFLELADSEDETETSKRPDRLIPATPLPLDALATADINMKLNIAELRYRGDSMKNVVIEAETRAGGLSIPQLSLQGPRGEFKAALSVTPAGVNKAGAKIADVKVDLSAEKMVANISGQPEENISQVPEIDMEFHASGKGGNLQEVAGSINGSLYLGSEGGTLEGVNLSVLDTFILDEIFSLIMPKTDTEDDLELSCIAAILKVTDGLVETDPALAFTTAQIALISKGTLDLKTEKMQFNFNATPNNALKISASELFNPYILVGGTLSEPQVGLDPAKVLLHGGAAIGTAGISVLAKGLLDRVSNTVPLCDEMLEQVQQKKGLNQ